MLKKKRNTKLLNIKAKSSEYEKYIRLDWIYSGLYDILSQKKEELSVESFEKQLLVYFIKDIEDKCWYYEHMKVKNIFNSVILHMEEKILMLKLLYYMIKLKLSKKNKKE